MNEASDARFLIPITFPANPTLGDQFTASSGVSYEWDGTVWKDFADAFVETDPLSVKLVGDTMVGPLVLPLVPTIDTHAATKGYVDQLITNVVGIAAYCGAANGSTPDCQCQFTALSGHPNGPLPPAVQFQSGEHLIVAIGGNPTQGPAAGFTLAAGDWLISDGTTWYVLPFGGASILASTVAVTPIVAGGDDVQEVLTNLQAQKVAKAGDAMTGELTHSVDGQGHTFFSAGRIYKLSGGGMRMRKSSGNQQWQIEDNNGANPTNIATAASHVAKAGSETITGWLDIRVADNTGALYMDASTNNNGVVGPWLISRSSGNNEFGRTWWRGPGWNNRWEAQKAWAMNMGGYGFAENGSFRTYTSGGQLYITNEISCQSLVQRSSRAIKNGIRDVRVDELTRSWNALQPVRYYPNVPAPVDENGEPLQNPVTYPAPALRWGFVAEDMPPEVQTRQAGSSDPEIVRNAPVEGYDVAQVLALAVAKIQALETELAEFKARFA